MIKQTGTEKEKKELMKMKMKIKRRRMGKDDAPLPLSSLLLPVKTKRNICKSRQCIAVSNTVNMTDVPVQYYCGSLRT